MEPKITNENKKEIVGLLGVKPKIAYWQLAEKLDKHENTVAKWMRRPNDEQAAAIKAAILEIRDEQER